MFSAHKALGNTFPQLCLYPHTDPGFPPILQASLDGYLLSTCFHNDLSNADRCLPGEGVGRLSERMDPQLRSRKLPATANVAKDLIKKLNVHFLGQSTPCHNKGNQPTRWSCHRTGPQVPHTCLYRCGRAATRSSLGILRGYRQSPLSLRLSMSSSFVGAGRLDQLARESKQQK